MAELAPVARAGDALEALRAIALTDAPRTRRQDVYAAMAVFAAACLEREMTQTAADTLAFLLQAPGVSASIRGEAAALFDDMDSRVCPRVILDARDFATGMDFLTMLEYLLDVIQPDST